MQRNSFNEHAISRQFLQQQSMLHMQLRRENKRELSNYFAWSEQV